MQLRSLGANSLIVAVRHRDCRDAGHGINRSNMDGIFLEVQSARLVPVNILESLDCVES